MKTILSGIQASGQLTLGNYLGALRNWVDLQGSGEYRCMFFIADLHSITVKQDPEELRARSMEIIKLYLACGLGKAKDSSIFFQSHVPQHAELGWVLGCNTRYGELSRMTQFKDKSDRINEEGITAGLFTYPALMAADILLYQADLVPVGADQKQHLELCRDLAIRFNGAYGDTFKVPEPFIPPRGARVMSLQNPENKMSKSDANSNGYVLMLDEPDVIIKKVKRAVTDSIGVVRHEDGVEERAGMNNLMNIYAAITGRDFAEIEREFDGRGYGDFKGMVGEVIVEALRPIREEYERLSGDEGYVRGIYEESARRAREIAAGTLERVYERIGFIRR